MLFRGKSICDKTMYKRKEMIDKISGLLLPGLVEAVGGMKNNNTNHHFSGIGKVLVVLIIFELGGTPVGYPFLSLSFMIYVYMTYIL